MLHMPAAAAAIWFIPSLAAIISLRWLPGNRAHAES